MSAHTIDGYEMQQKSRWKCVKIYLIYIKKPSPSWFVCFVWLYFYILIFWLLDFGALNDTYNILAEEQSALNQKVMILDKSLISKLSDQKSCLRWLCMSFSKWIIRCNGYIKLNFDVMFSSL